jgi:hypothetical protein
MREAVKSLPTNWAFLRLREKSPAVVNQFLVLNRVFVGKHPGLFARWRWV